MLELTAAWRSRQRLKSSRSRACHFVQTAAEMSARPTAAAASAQPTWTEVQ